MKIAVTSKSFSKNEVLINRLKEKYPNAELQLQLKPKGLKQEELIEFLSGCERAIVALEEINDYILSNCPDLKVISKYGVGLNNINIDDCKKHGVKIGWTGGVNKLSVAEMTLGFMLGLSRNLFTSSYHMNEGNWLKQGGFQLSGKTVGIIGVGHIGKEVIRLIEPFGCKILVNDIIDQAEYYKNAKVEHVDKNEIFKKSHLISVHTPLTTETENLFNLKTLEQCKEKPYIINTARGGIFKEDDLLPAIDKGYISGVAVDAYVAEPLDIEEIYKHKQIITTPHIGGNAAEAVLAMGYSAIDNLDV